MDQTIQNVSTLGVDDLIDAYDKLAASYKALKSSNEGLQQKGYLLFVFNCALSHITFVYF